MCATKPKNRTIKLIVKASELYGDPPIDMFIDPNTALIDDEGFGSTFGQNNRNFKTEVELGSKVTWTIETAEPKGADKNYDVILSAITPKPNSKTQNLFGKPELKPGKNKKQIEGTVVFGSLTGDSEEEVYNIYFGISNNKGKSYDYFPLDPKLQMRRNV